MTRTLFSTALILSVATIAPQPSSANDILDFLRAINGASSHHDHVDSRHRLHNHRAGYRVADRLDDHAHHSRGRRISSARSHQPVGRRSGVSFSVSFGNAPVLAQTPQPVIYRPAPAHHILPPPPRPGTFGHLPHELGQVVTCPVPIEPHVEIQHACRVAPGAIPRVIAVRDPHLGRFRSRGCVEQLAYVEVLAPPCPVQRIRVSPCKTRIRLDYGRYEINITSKNDCVLISYSN